MLWITKLTWIHSNVPPLLSSLSRRPALLAVFLSLFTTFRAAAAPVQRPDDPRRSEARARFDRGMALLQERDDAGALAEFRRAHELAPEQQTLLMIGVLYATMNRPVEALATLDRVLDRTESLSTEQRAVAQKRRQEQARKVGYLRLSTSAPAAVDVDGVEAGRTPARQPVAVPVAAGTRVVAVSSPGHLPVRREVIVTGGVTVDVRFDLTPSDRRPAQLFVRTGLPDAEVLIDGERVARTPLPGSIAVPPGTRAVELRRSGYQASTRTLNLGDGATAELAFALRERTDPEVARGTLALDISEPEAELTVDGEARGVYRGGLSLPAGRHVVKVASAGFLPSERMVNVTARTETHVRVTLQPTPERREAYVSHARLVRTGGWIATAAGAALGAAAGVLLVMNEGPLGAARDDRARIAGSFERGEACDPRGGGDHLTCDSDLAGAQQAVQRRELRRKVGLAAVGVGVAAAVLGVTWLVSGDDPDRYERSRERAAPDIGWALIGFGARRPRDGAVLDVRDNRGRRRTAVRGARSIWKAALVVLGLWLGTTMSCAGADAPLVKPTPKCLRASDCDSPLQCVQGYCVSACLESRDCPAGQRCVKTGDGAACQPPEQETCRYTSECAQPLVCAFDQQCRNQCQTDIDCPRGGKCTSATKLCADPRIDLSYDPVTNELTRGDGGAPPDAGGAPPDAGNAPETGPSPDAAPDGQVAGSADLCVPGEAGFAAEVIANEDRDHATPLPLASTYTGCLQTANDVDYFQLTVPAEGSQGGWVVVRISDLAPRSIVHLNIQSASDNGRIVEVNSRSDGGDAIAHFTARPGASFRVAVSPAYLDAARIGPYSIRASFQEAPEMGEPNNVRAQATPLALGTPVTGRYFAGMQPSTVPPAADWQDWYKVSLPVGNVTIQLGNGPGDIPGSFVLHDPLGAELERAFTYTPGADVQLTQAIANAGDYYIVVLPQNCCLPPSGEGPALPIWGTRSYTLTVTAP